MTPNQVSALVAAVAEEMRTPITLLRSCAVAAPSSGAIAAAPGPQDPKLSRPPAAAPTPKSQALVIWQERLERLLLAEAKTTNALALIEIQNGIDEAKAKIRELGGEA